MQNSNRSRQEVIARRRHVPGKILAGMSLPNYGSLLRKGLPVTHDSFLQPHRFPARRLGHPQSVARGSAKRVER